MVHFLFKFGKNNVIKISLKKIIFIAMKTIIWYKNKKE